MAADEQADEPQLFEETRSSLQQPPQRFSVHEERPPAPQKSGINYSFKKSPVKKSAPVTVADPEELPIRSLTYKSTAPKPVSPKRGSPTKAVSPKKASAPVQQQISYAQYPTGYYLPSGSPAKKKASGSPSNRKSPSRVTYQSRPAAPVEVRISQEHLGSSQDNIFRNRELEAATSAYEKEFARIMNTSSPTRVRQRSPGGLEETDRQMDDFYALMGDFYSKGDMQRHASPTKRLISQKNSTWAHKEVLKDNMRSS